MRCQRCPLPVKKRENAPHRWIGKVTPLILVTTNRRREAKSESFFTHVQAHLLVPAVWPMQPAQYAWVDTLMTYGTVPHETSRMVKKLMSPATKVDDLSILIAENYAPIGKSLEDALLCLTTTSTSAQDAEKGTMALKNVISHNQFKFATPYKPQAWNEEITYISQSGPLPRIWIWCRNSEDSADLYT